MAWRWPPWKPCCCTARSDAESWETEAGLEGQPGHRAAGATGSATPRHSAGAQHRSTLGQSQHCQASLPPRAAFVTQSCYKYSPARQRSLAASEAWWINSSATLLMQEIWNTIFGEKKNLKSWNSQEKETVSMKLRWRECIGNLGTRRSFAILSVYFPCTESWFLAKKKSQIEATRKKKVPSAL